MCTKECTGSTRRSHPAIFLTVPPISSNKNLKRKAHEYTIFLIVPPLNFRVNSIYLASDLFKLWVDLYDFIKLYSHPLTNNL